MNIQEAVRKAIKHNGCISRLSYKQSIKIQPLPTKEKFKAIHISGTVFENWHPTIDDLLADDWSVIY